MIDQWQLRFVNIKIEFFFLIFYYFHIYYKQTSITFEFPPIGVSQYLNLEIQCQKHMSNKTQFKQCPNSLNQTKINNNWSFLRSNEFRKINTITDQLHKIIYMILSSQKKIVVIILKKREVWTMEPSSYLQPYLLKK